MCGSTSGGGSTFGEVVKAVAPALVAAGTSYYGAKQQEKATEGLNKAQAESYGKYVSGLNPPESVKEAQYNILKSQTMGQAANARKRTDDLLASRGVRGKGATSPIADQEREIQKQLNDQYNSIYGKYNVPNIIPPVNYNVSSGSLWGKQMADLATTLAMKKMMA